MGAAGSFGRKTEDGRASVRLFLVDANLQLYSSVLCYSHSQNKCSLLLIISRCLTISYQTAVPGRHERLHKTCVWNYLLSHTHTHTHTHTHSYQPNSNRNHKLTSPQPLTKSSALNVVICIMWMCILTPQCDLIQIYVTTRRVN